ncbi:hypothetical protein SAMN05444959_11735 [Paracoccus seriniphilus]|uniref:Class II aldolase/adducin N-terminal domain-containing protein n=1 Tax=Paracoccus seriniphilus TaxID=184748 RepID=A0A239Q1X6_9RHOB|nr:hypothetical protein SAMN05444959_11735 [Paracoccus seriniphilus]
MSENALQEQICLLEKSIFDRVLTGGSSGNVSARAEDGGLLISPTGTNFGLFDATGRRIGGDPSTKEMLLHCTFLRHAVHGGGQAFRYV